MALIITEYEKINTLYPLQINSSWLLLLIGRTHILIYKKQVLWKSSIISQEALKKSLNLQAVSTGRRQRLNRNGWDTDNPRPVAEQLTLKSKLPQIHQQKNDQFPECQPWIGSECFPNMSDIATSFYEYNYNTLPGSGLGLGHLRLRLQNVMGYMGGFMLNLTRSVPRLSPKSDTNLYLGGVHLVVLGFTE